MKDKLFSQSARIDIATNFASFDALDFTADFPDFLSGDLSIRHFLTLIHEATHHWCLTTPVGTALAARTLRAYHEAAYNAVLLRAGQDVSRRPHDLDASLLASRVVTAFLAPLLEGMALYAEWRARPGDGGVFSRPFDIYARFSGALGKVEDPVGDYGDLVERLKERSPAEQDALLAEWVTSEAGAAANSAIVLRTVLELQFLRGRPDERARLLGVLSSSVDPRVSSYQLGYLFMCALERVTGAEGHTDMLLAYVREYFFGDHELAALILDEEVDPFQLYSAVRKFLQSKVDNLVRRPDATAAEVRRWGATVPIAPVVKTTVDHFFGRRENAVDPQDEGFATYTSRLERFCASCASEVISANDLRTFLVAGRVLMPIGAKTFVSEGGDAETRSFVATDGARLSVPAPMLVDRPAEGEVVEVSMLINVAAPGAAVSIRWDHGFEVLPLVEDTISRDVIRQAHEAAQAIQTVVTLGQEVIGNLHRPTQDGTEPVEAVADDFVFGDSTTLDILQVYRAAIVSAFASEVPPVITPQWRRSVFAAFEPDGICTLLGSQDLLERFMRSCGLPLGLRLDAERLRASGMAGEEVDIAELADRWFEAVNGVSRSEHQATLREAEGVFAAKGLELIARTASGELASMI